MKTIEFKKIEVEPGDEEFRLYPDYLVSRLISLGIGRIEAAYTKNAAGKIDFIFTSHQTDKSEIAASIGSGFFRPVLARLGPRFGAEDMLYAGHTLFACEVECQGNNRLHRFSLFVCNEPKMGIWMKLYLYGIDEVGPISENKP
jgi:hypothetical protein